MSQKYWSPLPPEVFDDILNTYGLSGNQKYIFEKLTQLDATQLREMDFTELGKMYRIYRQTFSSVLHKLNDEFLILRVEKGFICAFPTHTGCFGIFESMYSGIYRFVFSLPNSIATYSIEIFKDDIAPEVLRKLYKGKCYYLSALIDYDTHDYRELTYKHVNFKATDLTRADSLEELGHSLNKQSFVKLITEKKVSNDQ